MTPPTSHPAESAAGRSSSESTRRYLRPPWLVSRLMNPALAFFVRRGRGPARTWMLEVPGRTSGQPRTVPVNPLTFEGEKYLVAGRGETEWVRNLRVSGQGELRRGQRRDVMVATEVTGAEKAPILKAYLTENVRTVKAYFDAEPGSPIDRFETIADQHPVFKLSAQQ